jgi:hypothetical protein
MEPAEILAAMALKYSSCQSYSECGMYESVYEEKHAVRRAFATYFVRPDKFRFETFSSYTNASDERCFAIVWSNGRDVYERYPVNGGEIERVNDLEEAIYGICAFSTSLFDVPSLLVPGFRGDSRHLLKLQSLKELGVQKLDPTEDFVLTGSFDEGEDTILWISKKDFSIRQSKEDYLYTVEKARRSREESDARRGVVSTDLDWPLPEKATRTISLCLYRDIRFDEPIATNIFDGIVLPNPVQ